MFLLVSVRYVGAHPGEHQHGVSIQISMSLGKTFLRISLIRNIPLSWIFARVFVYVPPLISQILERFWFLFDPFWMAWHWKPAIDHFITQTNSNRISSLRSIKWAKVEGSFQSFCKTPLTNRWLIWFRSMLSSAFLWEKEGLGEGCVKITLIDSCLEWLTCLFVFIMVEFEKLLYSPNLKMVLTFLVTKVFQKVAMFKWVCFTLTWDSLSRNGRLHIPTAGTHTDSQPLPSEKKKNRPFAAQLNSPLGDSCLVYFFFCGP